MRLAVLGLVLLIAGPAAAEPPVMAARGVTLAPAEPGRVDLGALKFLGGLELSSEDPRFGGWSAGAANADLSEVVLVGDQASVLRLRLRRKAGGDGLEAEAVELAPLLGPDGVPLAGQMAVDAESLVALPEGAYAVGFEHDHRVWLYEEGLAGLPGADLAPPELAILPESSLNSGAEALAWHEGLWVLILEGEAGSESTRAFLGEEGAWRELPYVLTDGFQVTDAAFLEEGDLLVLERFYAPETGPKARLRRIAAADLTGVRALTGPLLAEFARPLTVDNYEVLLAGRDSEGPLLLLASDDNFNPRQRSLVMLFRLLE